MKSTNEKERLPVRNKESHCKTPKTLVGLLKHGAPGRLGDVSGRGNIWAYVRGVDEESRRFGAERGVIATRSARLSNTAAEAPGRRDGLRRAFRRAP